MLKIALEKYKFPYIALLAGVFYIAWGAFFNYKPFYFHDEAVASPSLIYAGLDSLQPLYLKMFKGFQATLVNREWANRFILIIHFLNSILFFGLFDKKNKIPWATIFFIFSPFVFYSLSLQDYRLLIVETLGIIYIYGNYVKDDFKNKNVFLLVVLLLGLMVDYTFLLFISLDFFYAKKGKDLYLRVFTVAMFAVALAFYDRATSSLVSSRSELLFQKESIPMFQYLQFFFNSILEFLGGMRSLGISFIEHELILRDLFFKLIFLIAGITLIVKYYRKKIIAILSSLLILFVFSFLFVSSSNVLVLAGVYYNTIAIKAAILIPAFTGIAYALSSRPEEKKPLLYFCMIVGLVSWVNFSNNSSNNVVNVHRNDAPVFWGVLQNSNLNFVRPFSEVYPEQTKKLDFKDRIFVDGLDKIDNESYAKFMALKNERGSLLDGFVFMNQGHFIKAQESVSATFLTGALSKKSFPMLMDKINSNLEIKLENSIQPLLYELLKDRQTYPLAESLYLISLLHYTEIEKDEIKRTLINEFGYIFKPEK